jgi:hypothetical protein
MSMSISGRGKIIGQSSAMAASATAGVDGASVSGPQVGRAWAGPWRGRSLIERGHELPPFVAGKQRICRICRRAYIREYMRKRRGNA